MDLKRETTVSILEKTESKPEVVFETDVEEKKQEAKKTLFSNTPSKYMENLKKNFSKEEEQPKKEAKVTPKIQFEAAETFFAEKQKRDKKQAKGQVSFQSVYAPAEEEEILIETKPAVEEEKVEEQIEEEQETPELEEETVSEEEEKPRQKPKFKTRLKIICVGAVLVLACMIGWTIANAVQIETLTSEMEQANKIYSVNIVTHISNISKADDLTNPDSIFNLDELSNAEVIPLQPTPSAPTEYSVRSNWFDRVCNWLSNLFS